MIMYPQAIPTYYDGYWFRSRLEARWAVFFNTIGIEYQYEKEGYDLPYVGWYLPDFWLPAQDLWVEVKGAISTEAELAKLVYASRYLPGAATGVWSVPHDRYRVDVTGPGLVVLGQIPLVQKGWQVWHKGYRYQENEARYCPPQHYWTAAWIFRDGRLNMQIDNMCDLGAEGALQLALNSPSVSKFDAYVMDDGLDWGEFGADTGAVEAYSAARSAQFEHGQSGAYKPPQAAPPPVTQAVCLHPAYHGLPGYPDRDDPQVCRHLYHNGPPGYPGLVRPA